MRAHELDRDHEGSGEEHRPQQAIAELGPGLGIGCDPGRIVVGRAVTRPGPEKAKKNIERVCLARVNVFERDIDVLSGEREFGRHPKTSALSLIDSMSAPSLKAYKDSGDPKGRDTLLMTRPIIETEDRRQ